MATINITKTYADGQVLLESDLDNFINDVETFLNTTKINDDNIQDGGITASSKLADGSISTVKLAASAVTTAKIADANITAVKLATDSVTTAKIVDSNVTTAKIADDAVTAAKLTAGIVLANFSSQEFTSSGTWTKPTGVPFVIVRAWGGGGGGAGGSSPSGTSGGGGSGSIAKDIIIPLAAGSTSFTVTVGAKGTGGAVGSNGVDGGDTIFTDATASVELYRWKGGKAGIIGAASGSLSISTYSDLKTATIPGGTGGTSNANGVGTDYIDVYGINKPFTGGTSTSFPGNGRAGGGGGAGPAGNGGNGGDNNGGATPAGTDGYDASANSGAGGGGGSSVSLAASHDGGDGGEGYAIVYWPQPNT